MMMMMAAAGGGGGGGGGGGDTFKNLLREDPVWRASSRQQYERYLRKFKIEF